ncbi:hypothetical protein KAR91_31850 [Candidatus Pacearchaeota archaeon]|nr:hypothetical protein [Candidatus Pacearchaeota archaeon]
MKSKYLSIIKSLAPEVVKALVPGGAFVDMGIRVLSETLLGNPDGTEADIEAYMDKASPEQIAKLKEAEVRMKALDVDFAKVEADDRKDARASNRGAKDKTPAILGALCFLGFFGILVALIFVEIPESSRAPLMVALGALGTIVGQIANYYWGSSKGSAAKNDTIEGLMK